MDQHVLASYLIHNIPKSMDSYKLAVLIINSPGILVVEKNNSSGIANCNDTWLYCGNFTCKEQALGLTDKNCPWVEFAHINRRHEDDALAGKFYGLIHPFVVKKRSCWIHDYVLSKNNGGNKSTLTIAYELNNRNVFDAVLLFKKSNQSDLKIEVAVNKKTIFSNREKEIIFCLCCGMSPKRIAYSMKISQRTVETHISNMKNKCNCSTKEELIKYSIDASYVSLWPSCFLEDMKKFGGIATELSHFLVPLL